VFWPRRGAELSVNQPGADPSFADHACIDLNSEVGAVVFGDVKAAITPALDAPCRDPQPLPDILDLGIRRAISLGWVRVDPSGTLDEGGKG
jgi:hypothetical protein